MKRIVLTLFFLSFLFGFNAQARTEVIRIDHQEQFDQLNKTVHKYITDGCKSITIRVSPGNYYFKERHLELSDINAPGLTLKMVGKNAVLIAAGRDVSTDEPINGYNYTSSVVDIDKKELVNMWGEMKYADSDVEILNVEAKTCRLKSNGIKSRMADECRNAYIMITAWCRTYYYKITKIEDSYIYFVADNLKATKLYKKKGYNVNDDFLVYGKLPRFRLCNLEPIHRGTVHVSEAQSFLYDKGGNMKSITIKGFTFLGNQAKGDMEGWPYALIMFNEITSERIRITNCSFIGQNSRVITIDKTDNVYVDDCFFAHNFRNGVTSYNSSSNTVVSGNVFENNGESLSYERCITCQGDNYHIYNNTFTDFGYSAISVGYYYGATPEKASWGIVEKNTMTYSKERMENLWKYTIVDGGAIYLWTRNDGAVIRNNVIYNYGGVDSNRGIYCDDGAKGFEIYGNIVLGVVNGYSIDSRRAKEVDSRVGGANMNNKIYDNVFDGGFKFVAHEGESRCYKGRNFIIYDNNVQLPDLVVKNFDNPVEDEYVSFYGYKGSKIIIDKDAMKNIKQSKVGAKASSFFVRIKGQNKTHKRIE